MKVAWMICKGEKLLENRLEITAQSSTDKKL